MELNINFQQKINEKFQDPDQVPRIIHDAMTSYMTGDQVKSALALIDRQPVNINYVKERYLDPFFIPLNINLAANFGLVLAQQEAGAAPYTE